MQQPFEPSNPASNPAQQRSRAGQQQRSSTVLHWYIRHGRASGTVIANLRLDCDRCELRRLHGSLWRLASGSALRLFITLYTIGVGVQTRLVNYEARILSISIK